MDTGNMEIERKFIIDSLPFPMDRFPSHNVEQAYISVDPVIRIRKMDDQYYLTCKGPGRMAREEWELALKPHQYEKLAQKAETGTIKKIRYIIPLQQGLIAELDIYREPADLVGFYTVEVEFETRRDAEHFVPPDWFGREVTEDAAYSNSSLIRYGCPGGRADSF